MFGMIKHKSKDKIIRDPTLGYSYRAPQGGTFEVTIGDKTVSVTTKDDTQDILKLAGEKMNYHKENCVHDYKFIGFNGVDYHCTSCKQKLLPNWLVKREPRVYNFETNFDGNLPSDIPKAQRVLINEMSDLVILGKRFKITAEEIE